MGKIEPKPGIMEIALYQGGASHVPGLTEVIKLSSNENPFGPSPKAIEAVRDSAAFMHRYPSTDHSALRTAIGAVHGLDPERIICGVGSDEIIHFLCQSYAGPGDEVVYTEHGFSMYKISARAAGASPVVAPERDRRVDVDGVLAACTDRTRLVFLTNPGNPTSTILSADDLRQLADGVPESALLVIDSAYAEFAEGYDGGAALATERDNVVMLRTFSKAYGLGGMRVGWGYAQRGIIDVLNRIRGPFNLSVPALKAAEAAVNDREFVNMYVSENARLRHWLADELARVGVPSDPAHANFILARFNDATEAEACDAFLQSHGLIVRKVAGYNLPAALRITVGDEPACKKVAATIAAFKGGAR